MSEAATSNLFGLLKSPALAVLVAAALVGALVVLPATSARAASFTVNTTADGNDGVCNQGTSGGCTLREAIQEANASADSDTIDLPDLGDPYKLTIPGADEDGAETGDLDVISDISIVGAGAEDVVVDATGLGDRVFDVRGGEVSISNITIRGGTATRDAGSPAPANRGGGVRVLADDPDVGTSFELTDAIVESNTALVAGGGVENLEQTVTVIGTDFMRNVATGVGEAPGNGGAIHNGGGTVTVAGGAAHGNSAVEGGGFWNDDAMTVTSTAFETNAATGASDDGDIQGGGALYNEGGGALTVDRAGFLDNTATQVSTAGGGASGSGGAILNRAGSLEVIDSNFDSNRAARAGGAIENADGAATTTITGTAFFENDVAAGAAPGNGGAVHNGGGTVDADDVLAEGNSAVEGGAFWNGGGGELVVTDALFETNTALGGEVGQGGGALYNEGGSVLGLLAADFIDNEATVGSGSGGAILNTGEDSELRAAFALFTGNAANRAGGAIENVSGGAFLFEAVFDRNDVAAGAAPGNGGAVHNDGGRVEVTGGVAEGNSAVEGGAFWASGVLTVDGTTVTDNVAASEGGAFYNSNGSFTFTDVDATNGGTETDGDVQGNVYAEGGADSEASATDSTFTDRAGTSEPTCEATVDTEANGNTDDDGTCFTAREEPPADDEAPDAPDLDDLDDVDQDNEDDFPVTGDAEDGSTVNVTVTDEDGDEVSGSDVANSPFEVRLDLSGLDDGRLTVSATATDAAGNTSEPATQRITKDTADDMQPPPGDDDDMDPGDDDDMDDDDDMGPGDTPVEIDRISGEGRTQTAIEVSQATFADGEADAVVLSRPDIFPDALAGTPLAVQENGPLLLTSPDGIEDAVAAEIDRVLGDDGTVILLGGVQALSEQVETDGEALGDVVRLGGFNRFGTAAVIAADGIDDPSAVLLADGGNFPDAVTAGAAAGATGGAVLLTGGETVPLETQAFLDLNDAEVFAIGGPAARAVPGAIGVVGADRIGTSVAVAGQFFDAPPVVGLATAGDFPDALAGGAAVARDGGPVLLTFTDVLGQPVNDYLVSERESIDRVLLFGGTDALSEAVEDAVRAIFDDDDGGGAQPG